jgi:hypothetical protein
MVTLAAVSEALEGAGRGAQRGDDRSTGAPVIDGASLPTPARRDIEKEVPDP